MKARYAIGLSLLAAAAHAAEYPPPVQALVDQGLQIEAEFKTPAGLTGYATRVQGRPLAFYLTPDGKHLIVGNMLDAQGRDLTEAQLEQHLPKPDYAKAWSRLEQSSWVGEGDPNAKHVVYVFTDPSCPYCNAFWKATQPYLGKNLQVRHIPVAILGPKSLGKAAAILAAKDQAAALAENETNHRQGGIAPLADIPPQVRQQVAANTQLMTELGASATPAIMYKDASGEVRQQVGMPSQEALPEILGLPAK